MNALTYQNDSMTYTDDLDLLSRTFLELGSDPASELEQLIHKDSMANIKIYRKNLFFGAYGALAADFPGLKAHLGDENFRFFVRKYLLEEKISSPNISDFSKSLPTFLERTYSFHQDNLLAPLSKIDLLYTYGDELSLEVPAGLSKYWSSLIDSTSESKPNVSFESAEIVRVSEIDGERCLTYSKAE